MKWKRNHKIKINDSENVMFIITIIRYILKYDLMIIFLRTRNFL